MVNIKLVLGISVRNTIRRSFSSALYITGDKAQSNCISVKPHINFNKRLENKSELIENISHRKLDVDIDKLVSRWGFYKSMDERKIILETARAEISKWLNKAMEEGVVENIKELKLHMKMIRDEIISLKEFSYGLEENVMLSILGLPNFLHSDTPKEYDLLVYEHLEKLCHQSPSHLDIAIEKNYLNLLNSMNCYLQSDAALFEYGMFNYSIEFMLNHKYHQFSNSDFSRSVVVEGCGTDYCDNKKILTLQESDENKQELNRLHLTGGASTYAFMAYFSRHLVPNTNFPLNYFCCGRSYREINRESVSNLFSLNQESVLSVFIATLDDDESMLKSFNDLKQDIIELYKSFNYQFKLVYLQASKLDKSECLRLSIQMFSNNLQEYVEVGHISMYGTYLSERLQFTYKLGKERIYPRVISGNILNIHKILGCALENNFADNRPLLSDTLKNYV